MVAGAIAGALKAEKLILLTDVEGVKTRDGNLLRSLSRDELDGLRTQLLDLVDDAVRSLHASEPEARQVA